MPAPTGVPVDWVRESGTIDDLVVDGRARGFPATPRLIHDWVEKGLLDKPERRTRPGGGSDKALWPWTQRNLFRLLADKRRTVKSIATLCNVPVGLWLIWGDECVPTRQVQRALRTWAGDVVKVSWETARRQARELTRSIDDLGATPARRERLISTLARVGYNGPDASLDRAELEDAIADVLDLSGEGRLIGVPGASVDASGYVTQIETRMRGLKIAKNPSIAQLDWARAVHHQSIESYILFQTTVDKTFARPIDVPLFEQPISIERLVNDACSNLCFILGGLT